METESLDHHLWSNEGEVSVGGSLNKRGVHCIFFHQISDTMETSTYNIRDVHCIFPHQISDTMETSTYNIRDKIHPIKQQRNGVDYQLFAIAFAVTLPFGHKHELISCDEGNL